MRRHGVCNSGTIRLLSLIAIAIISAMILLLRLIFATPCRFRH